MTDGPTLSHPAPPCEARCGDAMLRTVAGSHSDPGLQRHLLPRSTYLAHRAIRRPADAPTERVNLMPTVSWSKPPWDPIPRAEQRRLPAEAQARQDNHPRWSWARRRHVRRALIAAYLLTLAGLAAIGWIDALQNGQREGLTGVLWLALFVAILVEQALLDKTTRGLFKLRAPELDERQRALREFGYRYGFRILAGAATTILAVALYLPVDRLLDVTDRLQWLAIAIAVVYLVWMLPTILVAWIAPDTQPQGRT
jgi:hypothetical protein